MKTRTQMKRVSVDPEDAEDVRRGGRTAHAVEPEGRARDGLQLRAFLQPQEAGHLARLQEVERVRPGGRGRPVALYALQLLRPRADGHHVQLHILRLVLVEQHLKKHEEDERGQQRHQMMSYDDFCLSFFPPDFCRPEKKKKVWLYGGTWNLSRHLSKKHTHLMSERLQLCGFTSA